MSSLAEVSTVIIFILSIGLTFIITANYVRKKHAALLSYTAGLWVFSISVALEIVFSTGFETGLLIKSYLVLVAVIVELLALGSVLLLHSRKFTVSYVIFMIISTVFVIISAGISTVGDIITHGVVYGTLPLLISVSSITVTFPAAIILILIAALSYRKTRNPKLISIIIGVVVVSVAGTLYIVQFPAFLYYAEFIGILLLWIGFVDFSLIKKMFTRKNGNMAKEA